MFDSLSLYVLNWMLLTQAYIESMRSILESGSWKTKTTICWGMRDRWLSYDGVEEFFGGLNQKIVELPMVCHEI